MSTTTTHVACAADVPELVVLMRAYCDSSDEPHVAKPSDDDLRSLCNKILADPEREGVYVLARRSTDGDTSPVGFASLFWSWSFTSHPGRQAILSDLYVSPSARGCGVAGVLIHACEEQARQRGHVRSMIWQTATDNHAAQRAYQRLGLTPSPCADYELVLFPKIK